MRYFIDKNETRVIEIDGETITHFELVGTYGKPMHEIINVQVVEAKSVTKYKTKPKKEEVVKKKRGRQPGFSPKKKEINPEPRENQSEEGPLIETHDTSKLGDEALCGSIRDLWVVQQRSSFDVCQALRISIGTMNRIVIKYKLVRT